jgi:hypothetical protein
MSFSEYLVFVDESGDHSLNKIDRGYPYKRKKPFVKKESNSLGLQLADLIARPIGIKTLQPEQSNRAFDIIAQKLIYQKTFP